MIQTKEFMDNVSQWADICHALFYVHLNLRS